MERKTNYEKLISKSFLVNYHIFKFLVIFMEDLLTYSGLFTKNLPIFFNSGTYVHTKYYLEGNF